MKQCTMKVEDFSQERVRMKTVGLSARIDGIIGMGVTWCDLNNTE